MTDSNDILNDLRWCCQAPSLLNPEAVAAHWPGTRCETLPLTVTDRWPEPAIGNTVETLQTALERPACRRLGLRFERLWAHIVETYLGERLLACNLPIVDRGRTQGALDLVSVRDRQLIHRELAVKFYRHDGDGARLEDWVGPAPDDRLAEKLAHLCTRQLPLALTTAGQAALEDRLRNAGLPGLSAWSLESRLLMQGWLFHYWCAQDAERCCPPELNRQAPHGFWCKAHEARQCLAALGGHHGSDVWQVLPRERWLGSIHADSPPPPLRDMEVAPAGMFVLLRPSTGGFTECARLLVVPD